MHSNVSYRVLNKSFGSEHWLSVYNWVITHMFSFQRWLRRYIQQLIASEVWGILCMLISTSSDLIPPKWWEIRRVIRYHLSFTLFAIILLHQFDLMIWPSVLFFQCQQYHASHFLSGNAAVVGVGVDHKVLVEAAQKYLREIPEGVAPKPKGSKYVGGTCVKGCGVKTKGFKMNGRYMSWEVQHWIFRVSIIIWRYVRVKAINVTSVTLHVQYFPLCSRWSSHECADLGLCTRCSSVRGSQVSAE